MLTSKKSSPFIFQASFVRTTQYNEAMASKGMKSHLSPNTRALVKSAAAAAALHCGSATLSLGSVGGNHHFAKLFIFETA